MKSSSKLEHNTADSNFLEESDNSFSLEKQAKLLIHNGYNFCFMSDVKKDGFKQGTIYIDNTAKNLIYKVMGSSGKIEYGEIERKELELTLDKEAEKKTHKLITLNAGKIGHKELQPYQSKILAIVSKRLVDNITRDELNNVYQEGPDRGKSLLLYLTTTFSGILFLNNNCTLRSRITQAGLNYICQEAPFRDISPLLLLAASPEGQSLLLKDRHALLKLTVLDTLNHICQALPYRGTSPVFYFVQLSEFREWLFPLILHGKISKDALNCHCQEGPYRGATALLYFAKDSGYREALTDDNEYGKAFRANCTSEGLNSVCEGEELHHGSSVVFYLATSGDGRRLFRDLSEFEFINKIDIDTLMQPVLPLLGCNLHLMPVLPGTYRQSSLYNDPRFNSYKGSYILTTEKNELYYINRKGACEVVTITDFPKFLQDLQSLNQDKASEIYLPSKKIASLITLNGGHTLARSAYDHLMDNNITLDEFPLLKEKIHQWESKKCSSLTVA